MITMLSTWESRVGSEQRTNMQMNKETNRANQYENETELTKYGWRGIWCAKFAGTKCSRGPPPPPTPPPPYWCGKTIRGGKYWGGQYWGSFVINMRIIARFKGWRRQDKVTYYCNSRENLGQHISSIRSQGSPSSHTSNGFVLGVSPILRAPRPPSFLSSFLRCFQK